MPSDPGGRPVLCLITDRRRLAAAVGLPETAWLTLLLAQIQGAIRGGVDFVQIREGDLSGAVLADLVRQCVEVSRGTAARIIVNDRLDVAVAAGAHGVHLREDGVTPEVARGLLGPSFLLGRSVHSADAAASACRADYLIAGSVFESSSKPGATDRLGLEGLEAVVQAAAPRPVWAIGGVTLRRVASVLARGAKGVAAIGAFLPPPGSQEVETEVEKMTTELRFAFDSSGRLS